MKLYISAFKNSFSLLCVKNKKLLLNHVIKINYAYFKNCHVISNISLKKCICIKIT